jgi:hypothetical protein
MSNEVFELLDKQKKRVRDHLLGVQTLHGLCTVFAQGMNHRLKQIDDDIKELKQHTATNTTSIQNIEKKVEEIAVQAKKAEGITKSDFEARMKEEREETRERKDRELNIIIHGLDECGLENGDGEERRKWDIQNCINLFKDVKLADNEIKFCRRVGPRRERGRPLVVGFYSKATRDKTIRAGITGEISVGPDMTKKQREEEAEIWKEMEDKNRNRTEDQVAKNLFWRLVGPKGERRLILGPARPQERQARPESQRGRGALTRGAMVRGTGRWSTTYRPRLGSKRTREAAADRGEEEEEEEEEEMREPPAKH